MLHPGTVCVSNYYLNWILLFGEPLDLRFTNKIYFTREFLVVDQNVSLLLGLVLQPCFHTYTFSNNIKRKESFLLDYKINTCPSNENTNLDKIRFPKEQY